MWYKWPCLCVVSEERFGVVSAICGTDNTRSESKILHTENPTHERIKKTIWTEVRCSVTDYMVLPAYNRNWNWK